MALDKELNVITEDYVTRRTVDIYFEENVLLYLLMGKGKMASNLAGPNAGETVDGGKKIKQILEIDEAHSGSYGNTTKIPQSKKEIYNAALYRWAGYMSANTVDLDDQIQNSGDQALVNMTYGKLENIQKTIRKKMGAEIYASAEDADCFLGLGDLFNTDKSVAYGNLKEDDLPKWAANVIDASKTMSFSFMQEMHRTAKVGNNKEGKPGVYVTTDELKDAFENSLQQQARYADTKLANAGFDNILFKGVPLVADDNQSDGYVDGLNLEYLKIKTHEKYQFTKPVWEYSKDQPDTLTANVRWIGQLVCSHRRAQVRATDVSAS